MVSQSIRVASIAADPDGDPLTFSWSAPTGTFDTTTGAATTFTAPRTPGQIPLTVIVSDSKGGIAKDTVIVDVLFPAMSAPRPDRPTNIPVLYGTSRVWIGGADSYGADDAQALDFGACPAVIPKDFDKLVAERTNGTFWDYVAKIPVVGNYVAPPAEPADYIKAGPAQRLQKPEFVKRLQENVNSSTNKSIFIFIHGFANSFNDACRRTAQMAWDLDLSSAPVMFTWPAKGGSTLTEYQHDLQSALNSVDLTVEFLRLIAERSGATSINVIAHSLGNRVLLSALKSLETSGVATKPMFDQVILAAPDVDRTAFNQAASALQKLSKHASLYASSHDTALDASRKFWGNTARVGDARFLSVFDNVDTIDVSAIDFQLFGMGHAYFANNRLVIDDLVELLKNGTLPPRLHLQKRWMESKIYWQFPK
jgi:esterase/lipase superfamily enzyme